MHSMIPFHDGRGNKDEVAKIQEQIESIWQKTREEHWAALQH